MHKSPFGVTLVITLFKNALCVCIFQFSERTPDKIATLKNPKGISVDKLSVSIATAAVVLCMFILAFQQCCSIQISETIAIVNCQYTNIGKMSTKR